MRTARPRRGPRLSSDLDRRRQARWIRVRLDQRAPLRDPDEGNRHREVTIATEIPKRLIEKVGLQASSAKPVFVGIARKATVDAYLAGTSYATAKDLDLDPFKVTYVTHTGSASPGRPASQTFWAASAVGTDGPR
jgi:hypothetical protein